MAKANLSLKLHPLPVNRLEIGKVETWPLHRVVPVLYGARPGATTLASLTLVVAYSDRFCCEFKPVYRHMPRAKGLTTFQKWCQAMNSTDNKVFRWEVVPVCTQTSIRLSYRSCSGWYQSLKCGVQLPFESLLERDLMVLQDIDPEVGAFALKPETLVWSEGGREMRYTPDFQVVSRNGAVVYREAMSQRKLDADPSLRGRRSRIIDACAARGASFEIWTETEIRKQPRLANCSRIRAAVAFLTPTNLSVVQTGLAADRPVSLGSLQTALGPNPEFIGALLGLVAVGELTLDLNAAIGPDTELHPVRTA